MIYIQSNNLQQNQSMLIYQCPCQRLKRSEQQILGKESTFILLSKNIRKKQYDKLSAKLYSYECLVNSLQSQNPSSIENRSRIQTSILNANILIKQIYLSFEELKGDFQSLEFDSQSEILNGLLGVLNNLHEKTMRSMQELVFSSRFKDEQTHRLPNSICSSCSQNIRQAMIADEKKLMGIIETQELQKNAAQVEPHPLKYQVDTTTHFNDIDKLLMKKQIVANIPNSSYQYRKIQKYIKETEHQVLEAIEKIKQSRQMPINSAEYEKLNQNALKVLQELRVLIFKQIADKLTDPKDLLRKLRSTVQNQYGSYSSMAPRYDQGMQTNPTVETPPKSNMQHQLQKKLTEIVFLKDSKAKMQEKYFTLLQQQRKISKEHLKIQLSVDKLSQQIQIKSKQLQLLEDKLSEHKKSSLQEQNYLSEVFINEKMALLKEFKKLQKELVDLKAQRTIVKKPHLFQEIATQTDVHEYIEDVKSETKRRIARQLARRTLKSRDIFELAQKKQIIARRYSSRAFEISVLPSVPEDQFALFDYQSESSFSGSSKCEESTHDIQQQGESKDKELPKLSNYSRDLTIHKLTKFKESQKNSLSLRWKTEADETQQNTFDQGSKKEETNRSKYKLNISNKIQYTSTTDRLDDAINSSMKEQVQQEQLLTEGTVHYDVLKNSADGKKSNIKKIFRVKDDVNNVLQKQKIKELASFLRDQKYNTLREKGLLSKIKMMEIPNENKKPVNLQLIGVSAANQMNATAREQSNRPLDEQQRQSLQAEYGFLRSVRLDKFFETLDKTKQARASAYQAKRCRPAKLTADNFQLFGTPSQFLNYVNNKGDWQDLQEHQCDKAIHSKLNNKVLKILRYFSFLKRLNPDLYQYYILFLKSPEKMLKKSSSKILNQYEAVASRLGNERAVDIINEENSRTIDNVTMNQSDDRAELKKRLTKILYYHENVHQNCTHVADFLRRIGYLRGGK